MDVVSEFTNQLNAEWLPAFCKPRGYPIESFLANKVVSEADAADFLRALPFIEVDERGQFSLPRSKAKEVIFWDGHFSNPQVRMTLWIEPVVTVAAMARLHLDYGWPLECLGMQSSKWEFDITAFHSLDPEHEHIAGEVKATTAELNKFLAGLALCCARGSHDCAGEKPPQVNAHKKWKGLMRSRAGIFWALGPNSDSRVHRVTYQEDGTIILTRTSHEDLRFPLVK